MHDIQCHSRMCWAQEYVEASAPSFVVGEYWTTCVYENQGQLAYNQVCRSQNCIATRVAVARPQDASMSTGRPVATGRTPAADGGLVRRHAGHCGSLRLHHEGTGLPLQRSRRCLHWRQALRHCFKTLKPAEPPSARQWDVHAMRPGGPHRRACCRRPWSTASSGGCGMPPASRPASSAGGLPVP